MEFLHEENEQKGRFYREDNLAEIVYSRPNPELIIIEHTEVDESLGGQGIGKKLVDAVVKMARENGIRIVPLCPFAKGLMDKKQEEYKDVLYAL